MSPVPDPKDMPGNNHPEEGTIEDEPLPHHLIGQINTDSDEDVEGEELGYDGQEYMYTPLAQDPEGVVPGGGDSSDSTDDTPPDGGNLTLENQFGERLNSLSFPSGVQVPEPPVTEPDDFLWNQPRNSSVTTSPLDQDQADKVKSAMAGFQLPASHHPDWARNVTDDDWKRQLLSRLDTTSQPTDFRAKFDKQSH